MERVNKAITGVRVLFEEREQTFGEELANSISHGVGLLAALAATPLLIVSVSQRGNLLAITAVSLFSASVILLYLASTLYHALPGKRAKEIFQLLDHSAIYLLIAGSYTPFTFGVLYGPLGWTLFGVIWGLAILGIGFKTLFGTKYRTFSTGLYLLMGWLVIIAIGPLWYGLSTVSLIWLVLGGLCYTGGVFFFAAEKIRYSHFIWHLFVLFGTSCHFVVFYLQA